MWFKENIIEAANDSELSPGAQRYLDTTLTLINMMDQEGKIPPGLSPEEALPISKATDPEVVDSYFELLSRYEFLSTFSTFEFKIFKHVLEEDLKRNSGRGRPKAGTDHVLRTKEDFETIKECFQGLRKNRMSQQMEYLRRNESNGQLEWYQLQGSDLDQISTNLALDFGLHLPLSRARAALIAVADRNHFSPTESMIDTARLRYPKMTYDEAVEFLSSIGSKLLGPAVDEPQLNGRLMRDECLFRWFVGMARLARNPGNPIQWMPVLIGKQGCGKSQLVRYLIPENFQNDLSGELTAPIEVLQREPYRLHAAFLHELAEFDDKMRKASDIEALKNLVTTKVDRTRFPYDRLPTTLERQFGLIGTTNRRELFIDTTGNRRYVPISVSDDFLIPWEELSEGLNWKIWAAADIIVENTDEIPTWFIGFTMEEIGVINRYQEAYTQEDPWEPQIRAFAIQQKIFTTAQVINHLDLPGHLSSRSDGRRITELLEKLFGDRIRNHQRRFNGHKARWWILTTEEEPADDSESVTLTEFAKDAITADF